MLNYILWDLSGDIFDWGRFTLQWNGLLILIAFVLGRQILVHIYKKEKKPLNDVDLITVLVILTLGVGARIGYVVLYQQQLLSKPLSVFLPFVFKPNFHFTGIAGFSAIGGVLGIMLGIWLYSLKKRPGQSYLQVLDRISPVGLLVVALLLIGSFLNGEPEGKPTNLAIGTVMSHPVKEGIQNLTCCIMRSPGGQNSVLSTYIKKDSDNTPGEVGEHAIDIYLFFKPETPMQTVDEFMLGDVKTFLYDQSLRVHESGDKPLHYAVIKQEDGNFAVRVRTLGVARIPIQLIEAFGGILIMVFLLRLWNKHKVSIPAGRIFGWSMTLFWSFRFLAEFAKETQTYFIKGMWINRPQVICLILISIGVVCLVRSYRIQEVPKAKK